MARPAHPDGLYSTSQAAEVLDVPPATIRRWHREHKVEEQGRVPSRGRRGSEPLWRLQELQPMADAYHARRRNTPLT